MENKSRGVVYIAFGENFIKELCLSAESVKKHNKGLHITAFVDKPIECDYVDNWVTISPKHLRPKIDFLYKTPYDETIFLDTDTVVQRDITEMFDVLKNFDFAGCHDLARKRKKYSEALTQYGDIPYGFSEINTGVMVFKKNRTVVEFLLEWRQNFYRYYNVCPWDQPSFRISLWEAIGKGLKFLTLPVEYNIRSRANREKQRKFHHQFGEGHLSPRIFHMHGDNINQGQYNIKDLQQLEEYCKENFMEY